MKIGSFNTNEKILVIGEIGNNHEGSYSLAEEMIGRAAEAGVGAVKFQTIVPERFIASSEIDRIKQLRKFQLTYNEFERLAAYTKEKGILFLSTPFDIESVEFLDGIVPAFKIASSDNNFFPLLKRVAKTSKPILLSTGLTDFAEVVNAKKQIELYWKSYDLSGDLAVLHCVSSYPVRDEEANLLSIKYLSDHLECEVGYSDHTLGIDACITAASLGARIIEKHFTIDKKYSDFHDHQLSADPIEMKRLVEKVDLVENLLGTYEKTLSESEKKVKSKYRRSIAAKADLDADHEIKLEDLTWLRPGTGIPVGEENQIIGRKLKKNMHAGEIFRKDDLV